MAYWLLMMQSYKKMLTSGYREELAERQKKAGEEFFSG
jgi:hypothetical protein